VLAAMGGLLAVAVGDRRRAVSRVGRWAVRAGALWILVPLAVRLLSTSVLTGEVATVAAVGARLLATMTPAALALAAAGAGLWLAVRLVSEAPVVPVGSPSVPLETGPGAGASAR
jgi:hypothetical protein